MKRFYFIFLTAVLLSVSCQKELGWSVPDANQRVAPDFNWKMTQDTKISVDVPVVEGIPASYAVIRVYSSPILSAENLLAKGVAKAGASFQTSLTMPKGVKNVYIQTTLPDGTRSVKMAATGSTIHLAGTAMKGYTAAAQKIRVSGANALVESSMPEHPQVEYLDKESDFAAQAIIRQNPSSMFDLGAGYSQFAAARYLIPVGVEITGNINLYGNQSPYTAPVLYVAGKLTMSFASIGAAQLVVLRGGEVKFITLNANGTGNAAKPSIYVFEGGKLTVTYPNLGSKGIVNAGEMIVADDLDFNNSAVIFNTATGKLTAREMKVSNSVVLHNDGVVSLEGLKMNSNSQFYNYENGDLNVTDECEFERNTTIYQNGIAKFNEMTARGTLMVNCYTTVQYLEGSGADIRFGAGAGLDVGTTELNNTDVSMAGGAIFITGDYNVEENGGKNNFTLAQNADPMAVVIVKDRAYTRKGHETTFSGPIEVVYDNNKDNDYVIREEYVIGGAVLRAEQSVIIPSSHCNGGKDPVVPEPEPEPGEDYSVVEGAAYTYCFEDLWPYVGDYDMNDLVVVTNIDRLISKDGANVKSIVINWEAKAAGTTFPLAFAVRMDGIATSQVKTVSSTFSGFGNNGIFAAQGLEAGNEQAVVALFNDTKEVLAGANTRKGTLVPTVKYATTVEFSEPVAADAVKESKMNFFIVKQERRLEIHLPGYEATKFAVNLNRYSKDPYKFFTPTGDQTKNNYMMWGMMVPGKFRYPAEANDIRTVYKYFLEWAVSGGTQHEKWYNDEADESKLF